MPLFLCSVAFGVVSWSGAFRIHGQNHGLVALSIQNEVGSSASTTA
ncbi:hypothetical protein ABH897_003299 [Paenibacillus sp. RC73]